MTAGKIVRWQLFTDEAVYRDLDRFILAAERVVNTVNRGEGTLGKLSKDPKLYNELHVGWHPTVQIATLPTAGGR